MADLSWRGALARYRTPRRLGRAPLQEASFNSSYIEAIVDDLRRAAKGRLAA